MEYDERAFLAGREARRLCLSPIDNPHFANPEEVNSFNAWSDGWISQDRENAGPRSQYWKVKKIRGLTQSWEQL